MLFNVDLLQVFTSEMSGNVIDLCPVGAITRKDYKFKPQSNKEDKSNTDIVILSETVQPPVLQSHDVKAQIMQ